MKKAFLTYWLCLGGIAFAQNKTFHIKGKIGHYNPPAKVYLQYALNGKFMGDSALLKDGNFDLSGPVVATVSSFLFFNEKGSGVENAHEGISIYLEEGNIFVNSVDHIGNAKVSGSKTNDDKSRYEESKKRITDEIAAIELKQKNADPTQLKSAGFNDEVKSQKIALNAKLRETIRSFVKDNPDSFISIEALNELSAGANVADFGYVATLFENLSPSVRGSGPGIDFKQKLPKLKLIAVGADAPGFTQADTDGKIVNLASFKGKYVLIDFWASWCVPCRAENPNVVKAYQKYKGHNFTVLGISLDRAGDKDKWLKAIQHDGLAWTNISDLKFFDNEVARLYEVYSIPQNFLIDPNGKIIAKDLRGADLENKLEEVLAK